MQTKNVDIAITVTGRHVEITESMREYALKKIQGLHLDYPRIIEAKVILDVQNRRQIAEVAQKIRVLANKIRRKRRKKKQEEAVMTLLFG